MTRKSGPRIWGQRGQTLLEFSLTIPLLIMLVAGIIDLARLMQAQLTVNNAARQAIRYVLTGYQEIDPVTGNYIPREVRAEEIAIEGLEGLVLVPGGNQTSRGFYQVEINPPDAAGPSEYVEITVYYNVEMLTPPVRIVFQNILVRGTTRSINEQWGPVQTLDHANIPPTPVPLPTWTPLPAPSPTATVGP